MTVEDMIKALQVIIGIAERLIELLTAGAC